MTEATLFNDSLEIEIAQLPVALISEVDFTTSLIANRRFGTRIKRIRS